MQDENGEAPVQKHANVGEASSPGPEIQYPQNTSVGGDGLLSCPFASYLWAMGEERHVHNTPSDQLHSHSNSPLLGGTWENRISVFFDTFTQVHDTTFSSLSGVYVQERDVCVCVFPCICRSFW